MLEIFQNFEQMTGRFNPSVIIISGIVFLLLGLCMWLGGLALRKILISIAGLAGGIVVGLFVVGRNLFSASLTGALAMLSALILDKLLVILLAVALAAAVAFSIAAEPYFEQEEQEEVTVIQNDLPELTTTVAEFDDIIYELKTFGLDAGTKIKQAATKMPIYYWAVIATSALIVLVFGVALWRYTSALFFSVTGTMVTTLGIFLIMIYKGTEPVGYVSGKPLIVAAVFLVMAASGMIVQLLLCKKSKKEKITKIKPGRKKARNNKEPENIEEHDWRSA